MLLSPNHIGKLGFIPRRLLFTKDSLPDYATAAWSIQRLGGIVTCVCISILSKMIILNGLLLAALIRSLLPMNYAINFE
jgi:hypothetical protein